MSILRHLLSERVALLCSWERYEASLTFPQQFFEILFGAIAYLFTGTLTISFWIISTFSSITRILVDSGLVEDLIRNSKYR